ncbi:squalene/phytoene synthase family protein [Pseudooceanicola sp. LIPI14-2-Ac024]|uniref:squalene/phytoene synthase family protein n=1 Tax=Pseudooceanicola sp. LIPI14-2-Ac024 TaxID=3344875 RepID=UPI0035CF142B
MATSDFGPDLTASAALVEKADPPRFRAAMAAPVAARRLLFPLYAFNVEVSRAPWVTGEAMIAEMRLQWWRDALEEIAAGGKVRRHEVVTPLAEVLDAEGARVLDALVEARRSDIEALPFDDEAALARYLDLTSGGLVWTAARLLGAGPDDEAAARDAGHALGLANWLRAIPALEAVSKRPLPDGRPEAVAALARGGLERLARARKARGGVPAAAMLPLAGTGHVLSVAARTPGAVADGALEPSPFALRAEMAWRAMTGKW